MDVEFGNQNLYNLYTKGKCRRPRLTEPIKKKFFMRVRSLEAANTIYDLWNSKSLHFKYLEEFKNRYSIRLNLQWRLEFEIEWQDEKKLTGKVTLLEISKHYGD